MSELLGLAIISISILGLTYSIGNIIMTIRKPTPELRSFQNLEAYYQGFTDSKQHSLEIVQ